MRRTLIVSLLVAVYFAGCMLGPDYKRPGVTTPQSFEYQPQEVAETANTEWWKQFDDPVLDQFIAEALANNKSVKIAAANVEQAAGLLMTTRADLFPQVNYSASTTRERSSENNITPAPLKNPFNSRQILGGVTWEIDLWGRIRRLTEAAQAELFASDEARRGVILSLVAEVATSYIQLCAFDEQLAISQRTLKTYEDSLRLFELQHRYGQVSKMTVEQSRSQYETAAATIPQIESQVVQTENALSILLGRNPGTITRGRKLAELAMPPVPAGLPSQLLERRPDILQAEQNLIAANAQIGAAKALYFPTISLTGAFGRSSSELSDIFKGASKTWSYSGSIIGPIFTAGAIRGQVKQAEAAQKAALSAYEQTIQNSFADTENALVSREKLEEQLTAEQKRVGAYQEYSRLAWLKYNGGYTDYLDVLYAETQLFPAELSLAQTQAATLTSLVNIYKAMGGGWVNEADKLTIDMAGGGK
ncbi:MAG: efflux transporter outer membrane subunit [Thermodesulfobacteriota bacterium]|nr:MAG: efflux transporter outer membrane subunit [Thermodesulfobacteriota bacterium]